MTPSQIRAVVESFYADIWNRHDQSKIPVLLSDGFTFRGSLGQATVGHAGFGSYVDRVRNLPRQADSSEVESLALCC